MEKSIKELLQYGGDVATMRCILHHINTENSEKINYYIEWLQESKEYEKTHQNRITVINMINAKIKQLEKLKP